MNTALEQLLRPRLVLAVIVVIAATVGLLMDQLTGSEWGIAGLFVMHCAAWWLALCSYLMPPQEPTQ